MGKSLISPLSLVRIGGVGKSCLTGMALFWLPPHVSRLRSGASRSLALIRERLLALDSDKLLEIAQFVHNEWIESYDPTIEDTYRTHINVDVSRLFLN